MVGGLEKKSEVRQHHPLCEDLDTKRERSRPIEAAELLEQISKVSGYEYKPELLALQMRAWEGRAEAKLAKSRLSPAKKWYTARAQTSSNNVIR